MSQYAIKKKAICRWAGVKVPKGRRSFCSDACVHEHKLRSDPGYLREQAFQRDFVSFQRADLTMFRECQVGALKGHESPHSAICLSGDMAWYEGVAEVSQRFPVRIAILFMGAGRIQEVGPAHLTFTAEEAVEAARAFSDAVIIPLHYGG